jgi:hypothetical protein
MVYHKRAGQVVAASLNQPPRIALLDARLTDVLLLRHPAAVAWPLLHLALLAV